MTKYILNSGSAKNYPEKEKAYIQEILKSCERDVHILYCFFSQPRENWEVKYEKYQSQFVYLAGKKYNITFELALPDQFEMQCHRNDVILVLGGDDYLLRFWFNQFDLPSIWDGKIVATSSAGSDVLVRSFWTCDWRMCMDGMGIIPIKFISHYKSSVYDINDPRGIINWDKAYDDLEKFGESDLPIHALEEGDYYIIEK